MTKVIVDALSFQYHAKLTSVLGETKEWGSVSKENPDIGLTLTIKEHERMLTSFTNEF